MNTHLKTKLVADINALNGSESLDALLVLAKTCQPWLSEFTTKELVPLVNRVNTSLAKAVSDSNTEDLLIASKILEAINVAPQPTYSPIKAVYRVSAAGDTTITIPAVNPNKTVVNMLSSVYASSRGKMFRDREEDDHYGFSLGVVSAVLESATKVRVSGVVRACAYYRPHTENVTVNFEVIEYA